ncbi:hypothetical protein [Spirosoma sordidisoli]|uniref:Uncharacterized protein n=1 Tax=Spirosoma sordidisoli TaxID=2502893 RepID=A0A4Q2UP91_9BACT|nr:hypothetical protein [Spirosoma sordidisoli]RYC69611.1 hypothetical protein EQG79_13490 [Spirosoma sordidisoli]
MEAIVIKPEEIAATVKDIVSKAILSSVSARKEDMETSVKEFFQRPLFKNQESQFERSLNWAIDSVFQSAVEDILRELNFKEMVARTARKLLSEEGFLRDIAEEKVRQALGLLPTPERD